MSAIYMVANASTISTYQPIHSSKLMLQDTSQKTHVLSLKCIINETMVKVSKVSLIQTSKSKDKPKLDFGIATGHGFTDESNCYVQDSKGQNKKVLFVSYADNYKAGTDTDWALISTKPFKGDHITRYYLDDFIGAIDRFHNINVFFAQARGIPNNTQSCKLAIADFENFMDNSKQYITHNCKAVTGQSGSPITRFSNGRHKLTGFHLGHLWTLKSPITGQPATHAYIRLFDKPMAEEILEKLSAFD